MDPILAGLINVGFGGAVVAALIWFLRQLVTATLPAQQTAFLAALKDEREERQTILTGLVAQVTAKTNDCNSLQEKYHAESMATLQRLETSMQEVRAAQEACGLSHPSTQWEGRNNGSPGPT